MTTANNGGKSTDPAHDGIGDDRLVGDEAGAADVASPADEPTDAELESTAAHDGRAIAALVGAGAVLAALTGQSPTGNAIADVLWSAAFGAGVTYLGGRAAKTPLLIATMAAFVFTGFRLPAVIIAALAAGIAAFAEDDDVDRPTLLRSAASVLLVVAALQLPSFRFVGSASLLAAIAVAPALVSGWRHLEQAQRRRATRVGLVIAVLAVLASVLAGIAGLSVRGEVDAGITQAERGVTALQAAAQKVAATRLGIAEAEFAVAADRLGGPMTWPARFVPVVAQHVRAAETAAEQGRTLASTAVRTVTVADVDQIRGDAGAIDLDIVRRVDTELEAANETMRQAQRRIRDVRTPWLLPLVDRQLADVELELADTLDDISLAKQATGVIPAMLGGDGARTYMVLFVQPAESREFGGFVGAYGLLGAANGKLTLLESGTMDLTSGDFGRGEALLTDPGLFTEGFREQLPERFPQNLTSIPSLSLIAEAVRDLAPQWREDPDFTIDGVITLDPFALGGLLELTGPVWIDSRPAPVTAENVHDFLLRDQYLEFDGSQRNVRQEALRELAAASFLKLLNIELPGPERLGAIFGPLARGNRIAMTTFDDAEQAFLSRVFLDADMPLVGDAVEFFGLYTRTGVAGKLDAYMTRTVNYDVVVDPATGSVSGTVSITFENDAPPDAGPYVLQSNERGGLERDDPLPVGDNLIELYVYTRSEVLDVRSADGDFRVREPQLDALGYNRHPIGLIVPLGESRTLTFDTEYEVLPGRYDIVFPSQAVAVPGSLTVTVRPAAGWRVAGPEVDADGSWTTTVVTDQLRAWTLGFIPVDES